MPERTSARVLVTVAAKVGGPPVRNAKGPAKVKAKGPTKVRAKGLAKELTKEFTKESPKGPTKDSVVAASRIKVRESWEVQEHDASAAVKSRHGTTIDGRAHARAIDGQRWAARQTH